MFFDAFVRERISRVGERSLEAVITGCRVLAGQADDQLDDFLASGASDADT